MGSNKIKSLVVFGIVLFAAGVLKAQFPAKYWVKFKDKNNSPFSVSSPSAFLSVRSIARRTNQGIAVDMTDIPVNQTYINQVNATGAQVFQRSKWMNAAIVIVGNSTQLNAINSLTCVLNSAPVARYHKMTDDKEVQINKDSEKRTSQTAAFNYGPSLTQNSQIGADCMHSLGFRGQGMVIAVIDAGFNQANVNPVFDSLRNEGRILGTRDFVMGNLSVYEDDTHGANVLSLISGNSPGNLIGTGPKASVWLLRSEDVSSEKIIEECNWIVAAEFADSVGADITTTSLGYTTFDIASQDHSYSDLNGQTDASIGATMAMRKGIFVLNAAGNEGNGSWHYITVPADADSICTVGSVNGSGVYSSFSSVGPTADGRIKPDLMAMGEGAYVCQPGYNFTGGNGTSYATPILAGAVACLWQANPTKTNKEILQALKATANNTEFPNNQYGWGLPNMCAAYNYLTTGIKENDQAFNVKVFPNPAKDEINFTLNQDVKTIAVTDVLGREMTFDLLENNHHYTVKLNPNTVSGVYFLSIKTSEGVSKGKFVKE